MKSPFKFLDAFTLKDKDAFFGRDQEIETLYSLVFKTPLLLVYGLSGTGKTSLVQCGLASRFDGPDWYPIFIRRNENINTSVQAIMQNVLGKDVKESMVDNVSYLLRKTLRPVYLLFDQLEELFILGNEAEQNEFMHSIRQLLDAQLPSKIVFIMREEYIGQLYNFEKLIPELFDHRFRVEPMGPTKVKNVIKSSFEKFNIHLAEPKEELLDMMVRNISDPRAGITLPYLQVYLDMMYRDKYRQQYGQEEATGYPKIDITRTEVESMGRIDNVLERFLEDQIKELNRDLKQKFSTINPNTVQSVLDVFVSEEGTKRPLHFKQADDNLILTDDVASSVRDVAPAVLTYILTKFQQDRILRRGDEYLELAHDSLALIVDGRRSESQRQLQNIRRRLMNAYDEFQKTGAYLNQKQLASFEEFIPQLGLSKDLEKFLQQCSVEIARKASEEKDKMQQEAKMAQQKRLMRTRGIWLTIASSLAGLAAFMWYQSNTKANQLEIKSTELAAETSRTSRQRDSIANIIIQVDQQFGRMDSIITGNLPQSELVKSVITLKSLVRNDTIDAEEMKAGYISVIDMYPTMMLHKPLNLSIEDTVFQTSKIFLVAHLNTPQPKEYIQIKLMKSGKIIGEPVYLEVAAEADQTAWVSTGTTLADTGHYQVALFNSLGVEVGRRSFEKIKGIETGVSMTEKSEFRTMKGGTLESPGASANKFKVGESIYYYFQINSPKANERLEVRLLNDRGDVVWLKEHFTAQNTDRGSRGFNYRTARAAGTYHIQLINSQGEELAGHDIIVE